MRFFIVRGEPRFSTARQILCSIRKAYLVVYFWDKSTDLQLTQPVVSLRPQPKVEEDTDKLPTLDSIKPRRRQEQQKQQQDAVKTDAQSATTTAEVAGQSSDGPSSPEELEEQAGQEGAFNPETGEINWDCPCLGGMAHGPCGEEFKAAFSCFVYSTEEPKGMDCIEKFKYVYDICLDSIQPHMICHSGKLLLTTH